MGCRKLDITENYSPLKVVHRAKHPVQKDVQAFFFSEEKTDAGDYRFGFNGMERDDEWKGSGNSYDFGARIYDPRLGKLLSMDKYTAKLPEWSPYVISANSPVYYIDPDGNYWIDFGSRDYGEGRTRLYQISIHDHNNLSEIDRMTGVPGIGLVATGVKAIAAAKDPSVDMGITDWATIIFSGSRTFMSAVSTLSKIDKIVLGIAPSAMDFVSLVVESNYPELVIEERAIYRLADKGLGFVSESDGVISGFVFDEEIAEKLQRNAIEDLNLNSQEEIDASRDLIDEKVSEYMIKMIEYEKNLIKQEINEVIEKVEKSEMIESDE